MRHILILVGGALGLAFVAGACVDSPAEEPATSTTEAEVQGCPGRQVPDYRYNFLRVQGILDLEREGLPNCPDANGLFDPNPVRRYMLYQNRKCGFLGVPSSPSCRRLATQNIDCIMDIAGPVGANTWYARFEVVRRCRAEGEE